MFIVIVRTFLVLSLSIIVNTQSLPIIVSSHGINRFKNIFLINAQFVCFLVMLRIKSPKCFI